MTERKNNEIAQLRVVNWKTVLLKGNGVGLKLLA